MRTAANHLMFTGEVYECSSAMVIRHRVRWPELGAFWRDLRAFECELGDEANEEYWRTFIRPLRRYAFLMSSTPLATGDPEVDPGSSIERLNGHLRAVHMLYPDLAGKARDLVTRFSEIVDSSINPLLKELEKIFSTQPGETAALVLKDTRLTAAVERALNSVAALNSVEVVGALRLRGDTCFDNVIILGAPAWYPEYILTAPRAHKIHVASYSWLRDSWNTEAAFLGSQPTRAVLGDFSGALRREDRYEDVSAEDLLGAEDLFPQINFDALSESLARSHEAGREYELVDTKLIALEGDVSVFIEASENSKVLIIDPDGAKGSRGQSSRLRRIPVTYIETGTYLLLRTYGGGDYIIPVADRILGEGAKHKRDCQEHWKHLLREEVSRRGLLETSIELLDLGSVRAEESNVRNWMSSRNIRPNDRRDFEAIMRLVGLENRTDEYWTNAKALTKAHLHAGLHIRRLLLKEVATADLNELERIGRMDFELPGEDAGSLTAFCVLAVSTKKYRVPVSHLGEPFESEADLWPE